MSTKSLSIDFESHRVLQTGYENLSYINFFFFNFKTKMSWLNPQKQFLNMLCKVTPTRAVCRSHFMSEYPQCFKHNRGYLAHMLELPLKLWNLVVNRGVSTALKDSQHLSCPIFDEDNETSELVATIVKVMFLFAVSVGILYAMLKVASQRRT